MKGHNAITVADRITGIDEARQQIQGKLPKGPFELASSLDFDEFKPSTEPPKTVAEAAERVFRQALYRDARYAAASPVYLRAYGYGQALREIYDGNKNLRDGGVPS